MIQSSTKNFGTKRSKTLVIGLSHSLFSCVIINIYDQNFKQESKFMRVVLLHSNSISDDMYPFNKRVAARVVVWSLVPTDITGSFVLMEWIRISVGAMTLFVQLSITVVHN